MDVGRHICSVVSRWFVLWVVAISLTACSSGGTYAPVTDANGIEPIPSSGVHRVKSGETIYEIAWRYGLDYRYVARQNHLHQPYPMQSGQAIRLTSRKPGTMASQATSSSLQASSQMPRNHARCAFSQATQQCSLEEARSADSRTLRRQKSKPASTINNASNWINPASGRIKPFSASHKGINIYGQLGQPIYATAAGRVVYSGNGLRGYGNLIIIKHNADFLSAYAFNRVNLVKEGEWVHQGQKIAEMGVGESGSVMLHFEIRCAGKPVDPAFYLNQS